LGAWIFYMWYMCILWGRGTLNSGCVPSLTASCYFVLGESCVYHPLSILLCCVAVWVSWIEVAVYGSVFNTCCLSLFSPCFHCIEVL
jgi:hypothetical protein